MRRTRVFLSVLSALMTFQFLPMIAPSVTNAVQQESESQLPLLQRFRTLRKNRRTNELQAQAERNLGAFPENIVMDTYKGRNIILYVPSHLPPAGQRSLVIALHGGLGNAQFMQTHLQMDGVAEKYGFIVAYLNGSPVSFRLPDKFRGWNAGGGCCGVPAKKQVNDIDYITGATQYLARKYGVETGKVFGIGHSNGAVMLQTLLCETDLLQKGVSLAGSLMAKVQRCPAAHNKTILAIHGKNDRTIPPQGGQGTTGVTDVNFRSEADSQALFQRSGGVYDLLWVESDHVLEHIAEAIWAREGISLAEKEARFFGLTGQ